MKAIKVLLLVAFVGSSLLITSCKSAYISTSKPNKEGKVLVVGQKEFNIIIFNKVNPRAWYIDVNTGKKTDLEVVFE